MKWFPWCRSTDFLKETPPFSQLATLNLADKFFNFYFGVHSSEGTMKQVYYNLIVN